MIKSDVHSPGRAAVKIASGFRNQKRTKLKTITPATAARFFKVPVTTIRKVWPGLPLCAPDLIFYKSADRNHQPATAAVQANFDPADILTPEQLAKRLQVSPGWVREKTRSRNRNKIPSFSLGRYIRFHWPDVCRWMQRQSQSTRSSR